MAKPSTAPEKTKATLYPRRPRGPVEIEIIPGKTVIELGPQAVDRICLAELIPTGEPGTYRAVARVHDVNVRLTNAIAAKLGLGGRPDTLRRLIKAGFVQGELVAPRCYTFNLPSFFAHQEAVRQAAEEGRDFWTEENLSRYRAAI